MFYLALLITAITVPTAAWHVPARFRARSLSTLQQTRH
jgi:hypothetical protein